MYIYLDESYNLNNKSKKQFISINGFSVLNEKALFKRWRELRKPFSNKKRRIHAKDSYFNELRNDVEKLLVRNDLMILSVFQDIKEISYIDSNKYFDNKLKFDKIYLDMLLKLLSKVYLNEFKKVIIVIDDRTFKGGFLAKDFFRKEVLKFLSINNNKFDFMIQSSTTNILLELADFISNILYRKYLNNDEKYFYDLRYKIIQLKNPL